MDPENRLVGMIWSANGVMRLTRGVARPRRDS